MSRADDEVRSVVVLSEPATAAERLGVSASGLRRLASIYEAVHGELPRKGSGAEDKRARLWPEEAIEHLRDARKLVVLKRSRTILEALRALQGGVTVEEVEMEPAGRQTGLDVATQRTLEMLLEGMAKLHAEVAELRKDADRDRQLEPSTKQVDTEQHGPLVRLALWLERRFRD
jgi:hypothetical protein